GNQVQTGPFGTLQGRSIAFVHQRFALLQKSRNASVEVVTVTLLDGSEQHLLPAFTIVQPAAVLFAQRMRPQQYALALLRVERSEPVLQALLHALGALTNLLFQGWFQVFL